MKIFVEKYRLEKGWSITKLARESGVAYSPIYGIEHRTKNPTLEVMCKLSKALGVPCCNLFSCD